MSILTEKEVNAAWEDACTADPTGGQQRFKLTRAIESAVLAKLAGMELPKPFGLFCGVRHDPPKTKEFWGMLNEGADNGSKCNLYTADQLRQAYAQGAASVLSSEPAAWKWRVNNFHSQLEDYCPPDDAYDKGTLTPLYTLKTIE